MGRSRMKKRKSGRPKDPEKMFMKKKRRSTREEEEEQKAMMIRHTMTIMMNLYLIQVQCFMTQRREMFPRAQPQRQRENAHPTNLTSTLKTHLRTQPHHIERSVVVVYGIYFFLKNSRVHLFILFVLFICDETLRISFLVFIFKVKYNMHFALEHIKAAFVWIRPIAQFRRSSFRSQ